jgi:EmrB/QacA subfamily drug resistance transporter
MARRPERTLDAETAPVSMTDDTYRRRWWILTVLCTSLMIVIVGNTALNVAIPTLSRELNASTSQLQWMVDGYSLVFAGLLLTAGALGDRYGRRGALQIGLVIFLGGSVFAAFADNAAAVIGGRAVMGVGAALIMPATLSILTNVFPPSERAKAIAIWAGIAGGGAAIGPIASGFLLEHFWWGSVFLVNVPIIILALVAGRLLLPTSRDPEQANLDPLGAVLSIAGLSALVYAIIEAPSHGWLSTESLLWFGGAVIILGAFLAWEMRVEVPMLNLGFFKDRRFSVAAGGITLVFFAMFGTFFLITQYFQLVLGYGTLEAGLKMGPMALVIMAVAPQTPRLAGRIGNNKAVALGLGVVSLGMLLFSFVTSGTSYPMLLVPMLTLATGMALTMAPLTTSIMSAVPMGKAGVGSAMNDTTRELGGALGVAVLGSLVASSYDSTLNPALSGLAANLRPEAESSLAGALNVANQIGGEAGEQLSQAARNAYVSGMTTAVLVGSVVAFTAAVIVYRLLPNNPMRRPAGPPAESGTEMPGTEMPVAATTAELPTTETPATESGGGQGPRVGTRPPSLVSADLRREVPPVS